MDDRSKKEKRIAKTKKLDIFKKKARKNKEIERSVNTNDD